MPHTDEELRDLSKQHEPDPDLVGTDDGWCGACTETMPCTVYTLTREIIERRVAVTS